MPRSNHKSIATNFGNEIQVSGQFKVPRWSQCANKFKKHGVRGSKRSSGEGNEGKTRVKLVVLKLWWVSESPESQVHFFKVARSKTQGAGPLQVHQIPQVILTHTAKLENHGSQWLEKNFQGETNTINNPKQQPRGAFLPLHPTNTTLTWGCVAHCHDQQACKRPAVKLRHQIWHTWHWGPWHPLVGKHPSQTLKAP